MMWQRAAVGPLHVVEVHFADCAVHEAEQQGRRVFRLNLEVAQLTSEARNRPHRPEQPADVVDLVDRVEEDSAAKVGSGAIALAVILAWGASPAGIAPPRPGPPPRGRPRPAPGAVSQPRARDGTSDCSRPG